jgi:adenylate cyclase
MMMNNSIEQKSIWSKLFKYIRSIKFGIVFGNVAILLATTLFVILYSQKNNYDVLIQNTQNFMEIAKRNVLENINDEFKKVETLLLMTSNVIEQIPETYDPPINAIKIISSAFDSNKSIASIFFGLNDDYFAAILPKNDKQFYRKNTSKNLPRDTKIAWKVINNIVEENARIEKWYYLDDKEEILDSEELENSDFFPTKRPWFTINNKNIFWTDVYVFTGSIKEPGVTASFPINNGDDKPKGVLAIDITLSSLTDILKNAKTIETSQLYLIDDNGRIISSTEQLEMVEKNNKFELPTVNNPEFAIVKRIFDLKYSQEKSFYIEQDDHHVLAQISNLKIGDMQWTLINLTPDHEFLESIQKLQMATFLKCLFLVLASALIMFFFARKVSSHIARLSGNAQKIESFQLESIVPVKSSIVELQQLSTSMDSMQRSMDSFSKYVPKDLVLKLLHDNTSINLGGEQREVSLFFSDIEGFTSVSEQVKPKELLEQLTDYFTALTDIMAKQHATIDKFIGDSIMAFWGAPEFIPDHAQRVCHAALQIQRILNMKNSDWINLGLFPFATRIGIHTATVLVGNIGSNSRLNYTAIGDDVNLCSRLEGLNKYYKTNIIISGDTYAKVNGDFFARPLGKVSVKGKMAAIPIYELMGAFKHIDTALLLSPQATRDYEKYLVAFDYLEQKRFKSALEIFEDIAVKDGPVTMMMDECKKHIKKPPEDNWEGVVKHMDAK